MEIKNLNESIKKFLNEEQDEEQNMDNEVLFIDVSGGADGSVETEITYKEFITLSKQEMKDKVAEYLNNEIDYFDSNIMPEHATVTKITFDKKEREGSGTAKFSGEIIDDEGSGRGTGKVRAELYLYFDEAY